MAFFYCIVPRNFSEIKQGAETWPRDSGQCSSRPSLSRVMRGGRKSPAPKKTPFVSRTFFYRYNNIPYIIPTSKCVQEKYRITSK